MVILSIFYFLFYILYYYYYFFFFFYITYIYIYIYFLFLFIYSFFFFWGGEGGEYRAIYIWKPIAAVEVRSRGLQLDTNKACGHTNFPVQIIKDSAPYIHIHWHIYLTCH